MKTFQIIVIHIGFFLSLILCSAQESVKQIVVLHSNECALCLDPMINDEHLLVQYPCHKNHFVHFNCVKLWVAKGKKACPHCRKEAKLPPGPADRIKHLHHALKNERGKNTELTTVVKKLSVILGTLRTDHLQVLRQRTELQRALFEKGEKYRKLLGEKLLLESILHRVNNDVVIDIEE